MRVSTSSHVHRHDKERGANKTHHDPGWRWNRQTAPSVLSSSYKQPCDRLLTTFETPFSHLEESICVAVENASPSRFSTTAAPDGTHTASHVVGSTVPISSMPFGQRSTLAQEALSNLLGAGSHAARHQHSTRSGRKANAISSPLFPTTVEPTPISATWTDAPQDAAFPSKPRLDTVTVPSSSCTSKRAGSTDTATSLPSMPLTFSLTLIPPPRPQDVGKLVVVLDLDETLVYSRDMTVYKRPGVIQLLRTLKGKCEVIVWTAGTREYALDVIRTIDSVCAVQYCIYRHPLWWSGDIGCTKDLRLLGRPMDRVLLIDNTPSVFRANPRNSLLVGDFIVPHPRAYNAQEKTLLVLADIFEHVFRRFTSPCVADVFASKRISRQVIRLERGGFVDLNVLTPI